MSVIDNVTLMQVFDFVLLLIVFGWLVIDIFMAYAAKRRFHAFVTFLVALAVLWRWWPFIM